jgi:hypothetical protein
VIRFALGLAAILTVCPAIIAEPLSSHAREAVKTIRELRAIGLPDPEDLENGPPARVPGLLRRLNRELRELVVETLNDRTRRGVPSEEEITEQLRKAGWEEVPDHKWNAYGEIVDISFDFESGFDPGILVVSTRLWIPCGSSDPDSAIYVFRGRAREWDLSMAADADFDSQGAAPDSGIRFRLSPPDSKGDWFLAVAHTPPSCRFAPSNLRYKILRPGSSPDKPVTLLDRRDLIDPKFDPPFEIRVEDDWFAVTRGKQRKLDGGQGVAIDRFEVKDQQVKRIHPLALWPEDFLDEWVQLSWDEAAQWSNQFKRSSIQGWHSQLSSLESDSTELRVVQPCPNQQDSNEGWIIELWIDRQMNPTAKEKELYIEVSRKQGVYSVDGIQPNRPPGCPGNLPATQLIDLKLPSW